MKKLLAVLILILCVIPTFHIASCKGDPTENSYTSATEKDPSSIDTVKELNIAIKKNPNEYADTQISINGTIYIYIDNNGVKTTSLVDYSGDMRGIGGTSFDVVLYSSPKIEIKMSNDSYSLFETGDYVNIVGTVKISNVTIYLNDCTYTTILTLEERSDQWQN